MKQDLTKLTAIVVFSALLFACSPTEPTKEEIHCQFVAEMDRALGGSGGCSPLYGDLQILNKDMSGGKITYSVKLISGDRNYGGTLTYESKGGKYVFREISIARQ